MSKEIQIEITKTVKTTVTVAIDKGLSAKEEHEFIQRYIGKKAEVFVEPHLDDLIIMYPSDEEKSYKIENWELK